jgi:hypothetical protein
VPFVYSALDVSCTESQLQTAGSHFIQETLIDANNTMSSDQNVSKRIQQQYLCGRKSRGSTKLSGVLTGSLEYPGKSIPHDDVLNGIMQPFHLLMARTGIWFWLWIYRLALEVFQQPRRPILMSDRQWLASKHF